MNRPPKRIGTLKLQRLPTPRTTRLTEATLQFTHALFTELELPEALAELATRLGAPGATLVMGSTSPGTVVCTPSIAHIVQDYLDHWLDRDPREAKVQPSTNEGFRTDFDDFSREEVAREPYYQDFLVPHGMSWAGAAALSADVAPLVLSLKRSTEQGPFTPTEIATCDRALPMLRRAVALANATWRAALRGQLTLLDQMQRGAVVLDRAGRVLFSNATALTGMGLRTVNQQLRAHFPGENQRLQHCIDQVCADRAPLPGIRRTLVHTAGDGHLILIECAPLHMFQNGLPSCAAAIVLTRELQRQPNTMASIVQELFSLTSRETELCLRIAEGRPMRECAELTGITVGNAQQRAKRIFRKTGTRGHASLAALIARL